MTWTNPDGLIVKFGTEESTVGKGGSFEDMVGPSRIFEWVLDFGDFTTTAGTIPENYTIIPKNFRIEKVDVIVETGVTSAGSATIDVGLVKLDRTTAISNNGLIAALAKASIDTAGKIVSLFNGVTSCGALVGTTLSDAGVLVCNWNTAALTAGRLRIRVYGYRA